jgi:hypothetical protein
VAPNIDRTGRSGAMVVAGHAITIAQDAGPEPCAIGLDRTDAAIGANGGDVRVKIHTAGGCAWNASSHAEWISIAGDASGAGNGDLRLRVEANPASDRVGTADVDGVIITIRQQGSSQHQIELDGKIDKVDGACPDVNVPGRPPRGAGDERYTLPGGIM